MKENKYVAFYRKASNNWGIKNKSSKFQKNELKYNFSSKEEAEIFITDLLESERKRHFKEFKHISGGRFDTQVRCELIFLVFANFKCF